MTYCLAMRLQEGLLFLSDTRTNAGVDNISTYRKLFAFQPTPDRTFVLQSAGNLATTQEVLDRIDRDLANPEAVESLATVDHLFEAALYVGRHSVAVADAHRPAVSAVGADVTCTFILGGQIGDAPPDILLVYPEGNYIRASDERPFLQIGEAKYGKFMLELATTAGLPAADAAKVALSSMVSTARANLSVGPPYDLGVCRTGTHTVEQHRIEADSPFLAELDALWARHVGEALRDLPAIGPPDPSQL